MKDIPYQLDMQRGKLICGICNKEFPASYLAKENFWHRKRMTEHCVGGAFANFYRHLRSCDRKANTPQHE
jgi:hypothetical protein